MLFNEKKRRTDETEEYVNHSFDHGQSAERMSEKRTYFSNENIFYRVSP